MRRSLLTLFAVSSLGSSQPAQQQAQPPIVVRVEMPPTNPWTRVIELIVPGIIGAGAALLAVRLTNKTNERTSAQTRKHQQDLERIKDEIAAEAKSRDNRWAFRKDVYVNLISATTDLVRFYLNYKNMIAEASIGQHSESAQPFSQERVKAREQFRAITDNLMIHLQLARLATADKVFPALDKATAALFALSDPFSLSGDVLDKKILGYIELRSLLCAAGREDLWDTPEPGTKVGPTAQAHIVGND